MFISLLVTPAPHTHTHTHTHTPISNLLLWSATFDRSDHGREQTTQQTPFQNRHEGIWLGDTAEWHTHREVHKAYVKERVETDKEYFKGVFSCRVILHDMFECAVPVVHTASECVSVWIYYISSLSQAREMGFQNAMTFLWQWESCIYLGSVQDRDWVQCYRYIP